MINLKEVKYQIITIITITFYSHVKQNVIITNQVTPLYFMLQH